MLRPWLVLAGIVALLAGVAPALADGENARAGYEGVWSEKLEWCAKKPQQTGDYPVRIERDGWTGYEYFCDFKSIHRKGRDYVIKATCGGEGEEEAATLRMRRKGAALLIADPSGVFRRHVRCVVCADPKRDNTYPCRAMPQPNPG